MFGKVTEICDEIVSVALTEKITTFEVAIEEEVSPATSAPTEAVPAPDSPLLRHRALLESVMPLFCHDIREAGSAAAYQIISLLVSAELAPDIANLQPVLEPVSANASHPLGIIRALNSQYFPGTQVERQIAATRLLFRALGQVETRDYSAEDLIFKTGVEVLKGVVQMEEKQ